MTSLHQRDLDETQQGRHRQIIVQQAKNQSRILFHALLQEAASCSTISTPPKHDWGSPSVDNSVWVQLIRVTLLWTPTTDSSMIQVRGHACSTADPIAIPISNASNDSSSCPMTNPPIVASLAATVQVNGSTVQVDPTIPQRHDHHPHVKLSQWTRQRKPLMKQQQQRYKNNPTPLAPSTTMSHSIGEVLLVREVPNTALPTPTLELLEGLSSNVFVVYKDGSLHTASKDSVLPGYVRHLVLQVTADMSRQNSSSAPSPEGAETIETNHNGSPSPRKVEPIWLHQVEEWQEVFITSSSRLVLPVRQIIVLNEHGEWVEFWTAEGGVSSRAQQIQQHLLALGGY